MKNLVSVIIPVYNTQAFLEKALASVQNQTYPAFEVLMIDDGSTDDSGFICQELSQQDHRFRYIRQENGGVSKARNTGLRQATGKYVVFVDSDDFIEPTHLEKMVAAMEDDFYQVDIISCGYRLVDTNGTTISRRFSNYGLYDRARYIDLILMDVGVYTISCNKLFKLEIIREKHLFFREEIAFGEDTVFVLDYILHCQSGVVIEEVTYHYLQHEKSANGALTLTKLLTRMTDLASIQLVIKMLPAENKQAKHFMYKRFVYEGSNYYRLLLQHGGNDELRKKVRGDILEVWEKNLVTFNLKERLVLFLNLHQPKLAIKFHLLYRKVKKYAV